MKIRILLILVLFSTTTFAQQQLNKSKQAGYHTRIYQLTTPEMFAISLNGKSVINDSFLHTLIDSFELAKPYQKELPFGNYLYVSVIKNRMNYKLVDHKNVTLQFINDFFNFQFYIKDLQGNLIENAKVEIGKGKNVAYNQKTKLYHTSYQYQNQVIKVYHEGMNNFFEFEVDEIYNPTEDWSFFKKIAHSFPVKYKWQPIKKLADRKSTHKATKSQYSGYLVFSKPKYKPLDTIKFKAYVLTADGDEIKSDPVDVWLEHYGTKKKIATINPYRNGAYTYNFVLADSLNLKLDNPYQISLTQTLGEKKRLIGGSFRYEDYELKSLTFEVRKDRQEYRNGAPISFFLKAFDENELAVPDARVAIKVTTRNISAYKATKLFIPDLLWKKEIILDPVGETKFILPDSIFPKADLDFVVDFVLKNSNNETRQHQQNATYRYQSDNKFQEIKSILSKDSLVITYAENDSLKSISATLISYSASGKQLDSIPITLPKNIKADYRLSHYIIQLADGFKKEVNLSSFKPTLTISAQQTRDSLRLVIANENKIPFWYSIFSGNKLFFQGYATTTVDTLFKYASGKPAYIHTSYFWDDTAVNEEVLATYDANLLNIKLIAPAIVYPGQQVKMLVKVTDVDHRPVSNTDLTAQAITSKFGHVPMPALPYYGKSYRLREKHNKIEADEISASASLPFNWQKWGLVLGLDTIEYYKFTHPRHQYTFIEKTTDSSTQIAPFVMDKGDLDPVNIVYIDEIPVYFSQAEQLQRYSFLVRPGYHNIRLRTATKMVSLINVEVLKGTKTIISVDADPANPVATIKPLESTLGVQEAAELNNYMIRIASDQIEKTTIKADTTLFLVNPPPRPMQYKAILVGPFKENFLQFENENFKHKFIKEPGYTYTFLPNLIKQKSFQTPYAFNLKLNQIPEHHNDNYADYALKKNEIDSIWNEYLDLRSYSMQLFAVGNTYVRKSQLKFEISNEQKLPFVKNVIIYRPSQLDFMEIHKGNTNSLTSLTPGIYKIMFLFKDNTYFTTNEIEIKPNGMNFYRFESFKISAADKFSNDMDTYIKSAKSNLITRIDEELLTHFNDKNFDRSLLVDTMTGTIMSKEDREPIPAAVIKVVGLNHQVNTDLQGRFTIKVPKTGKIIVRYIGFESREISVENGDIGIVFLEPSSQMLNEVMVTGLGVSKSSASFGYAVQTLSGKVAGIQVTDQDMIRIRGNASVPSTEKPLIIIDGLPFSGNLDQLSKEEILDLTILKNADATAVYGASAVNGVIIIKTKKGNIATNATGELVAQQQTLRTNFSDVGFWQPKLITDQNGTANFTVKFPDDITNWKARVIAMNNRKQSGYTETSIKSFKSLSANFVSPLFAVTGDSINVLGKLMNYSPKQEEVVRKFSCNGKELRNGPITFKNAHIDTVGIVAIQKDSLQFEYTLEQQNGYFDGEIRKIPVYEAGVRETKGSFSTFLNDTTVTYKYDQNLGKVTLRAESSVFPTLLDEMTKLANYEYFCNEQLASKLKALLMEKQVRKYLDQPFIHEKDIAVILKKLNQNKKPQGTWGWWQNGKEEIWISLHAVEALLLAEKQGYKIELDKKMLYTYFVGLLADQKSQDQLNLIKLISLLDEKAYLKDWVVAAEKTTPHLDLYDRLKLMRLKQLAGMQIRIDSLLTLKKQTMFGNLYWGEESYRFWDNSIQHTILAYQILKAAGNYKKELNLIQQYFLEQRKDGQWRNTYESALILETILPELMSNDQKNEPISITLNNQKVTTFPYDQVFENLTELKVSKTGSMPVYFTTFQQFQNRKPERVDKDFTVTSSFVQNNKLVDQLKAGITATLKVEVSVRADADYVMIEVPIPAGCSYENKLQSFWGVETHREYFKNKTAIFCTKLKKGDYTFNITLMPRYTGKYLLNPAKAEMMYFPVFFGREAMKKVGIN